MPKKKEIELTPEQVEAQKLMEKAQAEAEKKRQEELAALKEEFVTTLKKAAGDRDGFQYVLEGLEADGFFTAPSSSGNHGHEEGGLLRHSLNVQHMAEKISVALLGGANITKEMQNSIALCALLHDVGKIGDFGKKMYIPNILKSGNVSGAKPFKRNPDLTNIPHGIRSVIIVERYMELSEAEEYCIMYHDGLYEPSNVSVIKDHETQLLMTIHWADMWASRVLEGGNDEEGKEE